MRREGLAVGLFFIVAGTLFLLDALDVLSVRAGYVWPLLLIGFGIALIVGARRRPEPAPEPAPETEGDREGEPEAGRKDEPTEPQEPAAEPDDEGEPEKD